MKRKLWVVRHAPTLAGGRAVGTTDVKPDWPHEHAALRVLEVLSAQGATPQSVWSSGLDRCAGLARYVATRLGVPHSVDARLGEIDLGYFEGRSWDEIERRAPDVLARWMARWKDEGPPGGESAQALTARVDAWLSERRADAVPAEILLVAHAGVARALDVLLAGRSWEEAMSRPVPHLAVHAAYDLDMHRASGAA